MSGPFSPPIVYPNVLSTIQWNVMFTLFTNNNWKNVVSENTAKQFEQ